VTLRLYDSATREVRDFVPRRPGEVGLYVCGATVQGSPHIGHMRAAVAFDLLVRWLVRQGLNVTYIRNVTDVDDKILNKAADAGVPWWAWAQRHEREFAAAYEVLGCLPPMYEPRATGHIPEMIAFISQLIESDHAYVADGSVYFDVRSDPGYGALTNQGSDEPGFEDIPEGPDVKKRDPRDFALWKAEKSDDSSTASWESPWGPGRPGWHIECSAMAKKYLGPTFDIHGGGLDLRFPHHENEWAQSRSIGDGFALLWMHSAWLTQSGTKMSKSLGNTLNVKQVVSSTANPAALRLALASVHYRSMLEYTDTTLVEAEATWARLAGFVSRASARCVTVSVEEIAKAPLPQLFMDAMNDDLAVPRALAVIHETVRDGNTALTNNDDPEIHSALVSTRAMLSVLGLDPEPWATSRSDGAALSALDSLIQGELAAREAARAAKDWAAADAIRDRLATAGLAVEDGPDGARWSIATEE
jgi:cysteinyl-tRNA synthetase